jgi:hypothetical protein
MAQSTIEPNDSIPGLLRGIFSDLQTLIRDEIALARLAIHQQVAGVRPAIMGFGIAAAALLFGVVFLLAGMSLLISYLLGVPAWIGFGIVGLLCSIGGGVMFFGARAQLANSWSLSQETLSTLKEDPVWIAKRLSSVRK